MSRSQDTAGRAVEQEDEDELGEQQQQQQLVGDDDRSQLSTSRSHKSKRSEGDEEWRTYQKKMSEQLALQKLREAVHLRNRTMLSDAIDDCRTHDSLQDSQKLQSAEVALTILQANKDLQAACSSKDVEAIREQMKSIRRSEVARFLDVELISAKYLIESLTKRPRKVVVLQLDKSTMSEIRRYQKPPPHVHRVMQAAWLLLGEDEETTDDWRTIQRLTNPQGHSGLHKRLLDFDASKVDPEMAAAANVILDSITPEKVKTCAAAWTFYVWAKGMCEEVLQEDDSATPANRLRQKELLGRLPAPVQRMDRVYYKTLVAQQPSQQKQQAARGKQATGATDDSSWPAGRGYTNDYDSTNATQDEHGQQQDGQDQLHLDD